MKARKFIRDKASSTWTGLSVYSSFHRYNRSIYSNPNFERSKLTSGEKKEYYNYWKQISPIVSFKTVEMSKSLSGVFNKRIIPEEFFLLYIEPYLNNNKDVAFLGNKSIYNKWFGGELFPKDFFHKLNNIYYTCDFDVIDDIESFIDSTMNVNDFPVVAKPNKDSYGGANIFFLKNKDEVKKIIKDHPDLVVQEKLQQSELINELNKDSINTVRTCLYKDSKNTIHFLGSGIRMGVDGSLDNVSDGGIICTINSDGSLDKYAFDKYVNKYLAHPNSNTVFADKRLPLYEDLVETSKSVFEKIPEARLVSLDMCLDNTEKWRCIEVNLFGQTTRFMQYVGEPFLGEFTDEVIDSIVNLKS
ncbi:sugar-transfer associated ATP-grasp domain-containing protein [uncultured Psychrobacter sp.]|uniref:sugar-transfer associated ATP-grasp domain-containing protein n=1 Tax=uncultured Psychrobacter sp. TaxID=259303 RepID=UPI00345A6EF3